MSAGPNEQYPVRRRGGDRRFEKLARDVASVIEQHAYSRPRGARLVELEELLFGFLYDERGADFSKLAEGTKEGAA